jgi:hypothetical protein
MDHRPIAAASLLVLANAALLPAQGDEIEGPWGTANGNLAGTAATKDIPYALGKGPVQVAWSLDVRTPGHDRPSGRNPITFDAAGNVYWKSSSGGGTGGIARIVSASPDGEIRWFGNDGAGGVHGLGAFDSTAVVVGRDAAYAVGSNGTPALIAVAYDKDDGSVVWEAELPDSAIPNGTSGLEALTPILYAGKLHVVAPAQDTLYLQHVWTIDASTGDAVLSVVTEVEIGTIGHATFVPGIFGPGEHGLYFNGDSSGTGADGRPDVYALRITGDEAAYAWSAEGGKVGRGHLIFSEDTLNLYAHTWADYGAQLYSYDAANGGLLFPNTNSLGTGHGFYDVGCLDFNGQDVIAGGFDGHLIRYHDDGSGMTAAASAFDGPVWWGEYRIYGQLLQDAAGDSILITGTNSRAGDLGADHAARVVAINVTKGETLWEHDSGVVQDHGFTVLGGPAAGPDGKVYYFDRVTGELVALEAAAAPVSRLVRGDANCSSRVDLSDGVFIFNFLFTGGDAPCCGEVADANGDGTANITDGISILNHLFLGLEPPDQPYPDCGEDPGGAACDGHPCNV